MHNNAARIIGYPLVIVASGLGLAARDVAPWQWALWAAGVALMGAEAARAHRRA